MRIKLLSKRYAQALFGLALENNILDKVEKDMQLVRSVIQQNREFKLLLDNVVIDGHKKIKILNRIFEDKVQTLTIRFLRLITRKGREEYIRPICEAFAEIYKDHNNIMPVTLTTAYEADKKTKDAILAKLRKITDKTLEVTEKIDEDLIGGFRLDFEDYQYDESVKVQLKRLAKEFSENLYISKL